YIPSRISGVEEVGYLGDSFIITNNTGYEIWYLYVITDDMFAAGEPGEDLLGDEILFPGSYVDIDASLYTWLYDPIYVEWDQRLHILAEDLDGDVYYQEWYPDYDSWDISLEFDSLLTDSAESSGW
ncbi:MAG: hypothetical protein K9L21_03120, partial [Spirochaetia bacterium]|nr:hypothetical protein [Spirochaetia bacterium]